MRKLLSFILTVSFVLSMAVMPVSAQTSMVAAYDSVLGEVIVSNLPNTGSIQNILIAKGRSSIDKLDYREIIQFKQFTEYESTQKVPVGYLENGEYTVYVGGQNGTYETVTFDTVSFSATYNFYARIITVMNIPTEVPNCNIKVVLKGDTENTVYIEEFDTEASIREINVPQLQAGTYEVLVETTLDGQSKTLTTEFEVKPEQVPTILDIEDTPVDENDCLFHYSFDYVGEFSPMVSDINMYPVSVNKDIFGKKSNIGYICHGNGANGIGNWGTVFEGDVFTIEAWIFNPCGTTVSILPSGGGQALGENRIGLALTKDGKINVYYNKSTSGGEFVKADTGATYDKDNWNKFAYTVDTKQDTVKYYLNDKLIYTVQNHGMVQGSYGKDIRLVVGNEYIYIDDFMGYLGEYKSIYKDLSPTPTPTPTPTPILIPESVTLDKTQLLFAKNDKIRTYDLTETILPSNVDNKGVKWTSSNEDVVSVDGNGVVTALSKGTATITVTTDAGVCTATCEVRVYDGIVFDVGFEAYDTTDCKVWAALYDDKDKMVNLKRVDANDNVTVMFDEGVTGKYAKVMLWNVFTPVMKEFIKEF